MNTPVLHPCGAPMWFTSVLHTCGSPLCCTPVLHPCAALLCYTPVLHTCATPLCCTPSAACCARGGGRRSRPTEVRAKDQGPIGCGEGQPASGAGRCRQAHEQGLERKWRAGMRQGPRRYRPRCYWEPQPRCYFASRSGTCSSSPIASLLPRHAVFGTRTRLEDIPEAVRLARAFVRHTQGTPCPSRPRMPGEEGYRHGTFSMSTSSEL